MTIRYLESRGRIHLEPANIMADVMRHFHARHHLGKAVIVGEDPAAMLALAHKQWLKLSRTLQRRRGGATNAVEILKYTYTITQMQHLVMVAAPAHEQPEAHMFFVRPEQLRFLPANCLSIYLAADLTDRQMERLAAELPASSLLVDYVGQYEINDFGLKPKSLLETKVLTAWHTVSEFLDDHEVQIELLSANRKTELVDDAIDALLGVDAEFLAVSQTFQRALDLARPLRSVSKDQRSQFDVLLMLAHRIQTLMPGAFTAQFLSTYADDTFFLNDRQHGLESLAEAIERHRQAGRVNLVRALMQFEQMPATSGLTATATTL